MAKALLGYVYADQRTPVVLVTENARLRRRVADLEEFVMRLTAENDRLAADLAESTAGGERSREELQPA